MVGGLNAEAAEFIPTAAVVQVAAATSARDAASGDRRQSGRNPRRGGRGETGSTGQHSRKSTGRRDILSNGGRSVNPASHQRTRRSTTSGREAALAGHPEESPGAAELVSVSLAQHGGRRGNSRWVSSIMNNVTRGCVSVAPDVSLGIPKAAVLLDCVRTKCVMPPLLLRTSRGVSLPAHHWCCTHRTSQR